MKASLADRYTLERELGRGGMAAVWLAEDVRHHRLVAIKVLHPELSAVLGPERFLKAIVLTGGWRDVMTLLAATSTPTRRRC